MTHGLLLEVVIFQKIVIDIKILVVLVRYLDQVQSLILQDLIILENQDLGKDSNMTIVCPSNWLAKCAKRSSIFYDKLCR